MERAAVAPADDTPESREAGPASLSALLAGWAKRSPRAVAFTDQGDREDWSGRPSIAWTAAAADAMASRLAAAFGRLRLAPGSPVAICLPGGSEACLAILGVERAGLLPCLVPIAASEAAIAGAIEAAQARAAITQSIVADLRPAETLRRIARRYFGLRCVAAFGPSVPDGVMDLDRVLVEECGTDLVSSGPDGAAAGLGLVTFENRDGGLAPMHRSAQACLAAGLVVAEARPTIAGERILSLLAADDVAAVTTGLVASLLGRTRLETHGLFGAAALSEALRDPSPTHLVAPAWTEEALADGIATSLASIALVHRPPARFKRTGRLRNGVVDVLALGERAVLVARREPEGRSGLSIRPAGLGPAVGERQPLEAVRDEAGRVFVRGAAAETRPLDSGRHMHQRLWQDWCDAGCVVETLGDYLVSASPA